jgi:hypothetical protein
MSTYRDGFEAALELVLAELDRYKPEERGSFVGRVQTILAIVKEDKLDTLKREFGLLPLE